MIAPNHSSRLLSRSLAFEISGKKGLPPPWLIVAGDFSLSGGMDKANYHLAWHLAERARAPVHLVAHRVAEPLASHPLVRVHLVRRPFGRHFLGAGHLARVGRRLARALTKADARTRVIVNGGNCQWPGINWVHMVQHACPCVDAGAPWWFRLKNRAGRLLDRRKEARVLHDSRLIVSNSDATRHYVVEDVGVDSSRVHRIYYGVDAEQYGLVGEIERNAARAKFGFQGSTPIILFVGALGYDRRKGFDTLLAALPKVRSLLGCPVYLLAAGGGALAHWQKRVGSSGLSDSVRLLGHVECIPTLLAAADVFVSPVRYEPYGLNVHEAICRGVPAIVSRSAGVAERYPSELASLLLDDPENPCELAERMAGALRDREVHALYTRRLGVAWLDYTWASMAAAMARLVEESSL